MEKDIKLMTDDRVEDVSKFTERYKDQPASLLFEYITIQEFLEIVVLLQKM